MAPTSLGMGSLVFTENEKIMIFNVFGSSDTPKKPILSEKKVELPKPKSKLTPSLIIGTLMGISMGSLPSGFSIGSLNTPQNVLMAFCNESLINREVTLDHYKLSLLWSICVSILLLGAIVGTLLTNVVSNFFGRKPSLLFIGVLFIISSLLFIATEYFAMVELFLIARFIAGTHSGLASSLVPLYILEISPSELKGLIGVLHALGLNVGMLSAQILGRENILGTPDLWPYLLAAGSLFIIFAFLLYPWSPLSPVYLFVVKGREDKALDVLKNLRRQSSPSMEEELFLLRKEVKEKRDSVEYSMGSLLISPLFRSSVVLIIMFHIGQQLSGINAIFYYSTKIFEGIGMTIQQSQYGSIGAVLLNVIFAMISMYLIKKCRRRSLLLTSIFGTVVCLIGLTISMQLKNIPGISFVTLSFFMAYVCLFAIGYGSIPWSLPSELVNAQATPSAMALGGLFNWMANFAVALLFPLMKIALQDFVFLLFALISTLVGTIGFFFLPETNPLLPMKDDYSINSC